MNQKICGYELDEQQKQIVLDNSDHLLVVAGAGSGKTLTILGKLYYLIEKRNINPNEIICISFTKAASDSLRDKIKKEFNYHIPVYTFHKLSLEILKEKNYKIADPHTLNDIIDEFFTEDILNYPIYFKKLCRYLKIKQKDYQNNNLKLENLKRVLSTFIHLFKCNNYELKNFISFLKKAKWNIFSYLKEKFLLLLLLNIYLKYEAYLKENHEIDFDDMLINATNEVHKRGFSKTIQYIIIDEYQDTSFIRFELIKEILECTKSKLMVVGDDFQSIYRFTGCDISLFLDFKNYFQDAKIRKIENTYRNSQQLIEIASSFVMRNKRQLQKNLHSSKQLRYPIHIVYYQNKKAAFIYLIDMIYKETKKPILILGRNNKDIESVIDKDDFKLQGNKLIYLKNAKIILTYLTVHKSKGLEEENVIIINLTNDLLGFPTKLEDEKILRFVTNQKEKYPFSEERRLFYVALTRTKNKVYLLTPQKDPSLFVCELLQIYRNKLIKYVL